MAARFRDGLDDRFPELIRQFRQIRFRNLPQVNRTVDGVE
jgi:hypothetical protein